MARAKEAAERYPDDAELVWLYGNAIQRAGRSYEATPVYLHALELDPRFAEALCETDYPDKDLDLRNLDRCLEISPRAASCLRTRDSIYEERGRCEDVAADTKRMVVIEPRGPRAYWWRAQALAQERAPLEAVREALEKRASLELTDTRRSRDLTEGQLWLALLTGDLAMAGTAARDLDAFAQSELSEQDHFEALSAMFDVLVEAGDRRAALDLADAYDRRARAWTADRPLGLRMRIAWFRFHAGRLDGGGLDDVRRELVRQGVSLGARADETWRAAYARDCETEDDARAALATLPDGGPEVVGMRGLQAAILGHALLLVGRPLDAVPLLREAASACSAMPGAVNLNLVEGITTIQYLRAYLWLGEALEQTGDRAGACAAYEEVMTRWSHPKPRSITVDKAGERRKSLRCAD